MNRFFLFPNRVFPFFFRTLFFAALLAFVFCICGGAVSGFAHDIPANAKPSILNQVSFTPPLNQSVPLDLAFLDENGRPVQLQEYARGKPIILALVYYTCPVLCDQVVEGIATGLRPLSFNAGKDFQVVTVSFDPHETPADALLKKNDAIARYHHANTASGWHFLTGHEASITALTNAAGFHYAYDPETKTYVHAAGILVLTPEGKISRYLSGMEYAPRDLKLALLDAAEGKAGALTDQVLLFCYQYNPSNGKYGPAIARLLYWSGIVTVLALTAIIFFLWRHAKPSDSGRMREV